MNKPAQNHYHAHMAVLLATFIWGSSFVALKVAVTQMPPMIVVFLRLLIAASFFLLAWPWIRKRLYYQAGDWLYLLGMALCEPCLYFIFESFALTQTSAGQAGIVTAMLPVMVAVMAFVFLAERTGKRQWLGLIIALAGVIWMSTSGIPTENATNPLLGNFLQFLAMVCAVGYTLLAKHLSQRYSALLLTGLQSLVGVIFFLPFALLSDWPQRISMSEIGLLVYLGLIVSLGAYGLYNYSLGFLKASVSAGYTNLLPVFALMFSMLLLNERLTLTQWIAIGVVFGGVLLSREAKVKNPVQIPVQIPVQKKGLQQKL